MEEALSFSLASVFLVCILLTILINWAVLRFLVESNLGPGSGFGLRAPWVDIHTLYGMSLHWSLSALPFLATENLKSRRQGTSYGRARIVERNLVRSFK